MKVTILVPRVVIIPDDRMQEVYERAISWWGEENIPDGRLWIGDLLEQAKRDGLIALPRSYTVEETDDDMFGKEDVAQFDKPKKKKKK